MQSTGHNNSTSYFTRFTAKLKLVYLLLKAPQKWQLLQNIYPEAFSVRATYVNLLLPLAILQELPFAVFILANGDIWYAILISILKIAIVISTVTLPTLILQLLTRSSQSKINNHKIYAILPYCFVPWLAGNFLSALITTATPLLLLGFQWLLPLAGIVLSIYMVHSYLRYFMNYNYMHKLIALIIISLMVLLVWWNVFAVEDWLIGLVSAYIPL